MDWSPWFPLITALIGAAVSLGTVLLTQGLAERRESRREKQKREDDAVADLRTEARRVADLFLAETIEYERIATATVENDEFDARYGEHLYAESLYRLGQAINMLPNAEARAQLRMIVGNLPDRESFPSILIGTPSWILTVPLLLNAALDIASAYARGESPDLDDGKWFRRIEAASSQLSDEIARAKAMHPAYIMQAVKAQEEAARGDG
ncbi:hypothetical protein E0W80_01875 [Microbacterium sp. PI-1]|uniref:hypothetical protein n=1 Tax=Microbacterium sp. PI-1 TaxID=2545631 RepID=UPI00103E4604|nr:hypothetical protein [Microbacterium sp. PI-1]TCJ29811.1 hypothetical protein E0W80_01875 [Microbacterium sp. PI-1]